LFKSKSEWRIIENMINDDQLIETQYNNYKFYMRKLG